MEDNVFKVSLRIFALLLLITIILMDDFPFYKKMIYKDTQLFIGILIICSIYYDATLGFILALCLFLIYYEIYSKLKTKINNNEKSKYAKDKDSKETFFISNDDIQNKIEETKKIENENDVIQLNYISDEHLIAAQNNIVDIENYMSEIKGIDKGFNNEGVYGAQGLDSTNLNKEGYDQNNIYALVL